jgi:hypothetical protein
MTQKTLGCLFFGAALALAGCSGGRGDVSGVVKYKGEPVPGGTIMFHGQPSGVWSSEIKKDGSYTVVGIPAGTVKISVMLPVPNTVLPGGAGAKMPVIPPKYGDSEKSGLTYTVHGGSQTYPVDLVD